MSQIYIIKRICLFSIIALCLSTSIVVAQVPFDLERIQRATVLITQIQNVGGENVITCVGSGTIVNDSGLILTNAHNTLTSPDCPGNQLIVSLNIRLGEPPIPTYQADVADFNEGLDIALLQISREFDGRLLDIDELSLPFVEVGNSDTTRLDETITVIGFENIGDDGVVHVTGSVTGFTSEPTGDKSWLKVETSIDASVSLAGTMTGGGAYNRNGTLIGIPTTAPVSRQTNAITTCLYVQDSNSDGNINNLDRCVPIGGSINAIRPSNFAQPLIRAASLGLRVNRLSEGSVEGNNIVGEPLIRRTFFAESVNDDMPTTVISGNSPSGTDSLYLFFEYQNMSTDDVYELRVSVNGNISPIFSLAPVKWSGGKQGLWYIGSSEQVWPNGEYVFTLFVNGIAAAPPNTLLIEGTFSPTPRFSSISFGLADGNQLFSVARVLGTGNTVRARFQYNNMQQDINWAAIWYYNDVEFVRDEQVWGYDVSAVNNGSYDIGITEANGLPPGNYRLELYIEGRLSALSTFIIAGARDETLPLPRVFNREQLKFVVANTPEDARASSPITSFSNAIETLYAVFDWEQIAQGTMWQMRWLVDDLVFYDQTSSWSNAETGQGFITQLTGNPLVPDGTYRMELLINNVLLGRIEIEIGIGQLPLDIIAQSEGVQLRGTIIDGMTQLGIPNITFLIISEDFSVDEFVGNTNQLYAVATTDRNGRFVFDRPLRYDAPYSVLISAEGYLPIAADGVVVNEDTENPLDLTIYLTRD